MLSGAALALTLSQPAMAFRAETNSAGTGTPLQVGDDQEVVAVGPTQAKFASLRKDLTIKWNARQGVPSLVAGANLLPGVATASPRTAGAQPADSGRQAVAVMNALAPLYGVTDAAREFRVGPTTTGITGASHVRLNQTYQGLPVIGGQIIVHFAANGIPRSVNGTYCRGVAMPTSPAISSAQALAIAQADQASRGLADGTVVEQPALVVFALGKPAALAYQLSIFHNEGGDIARWRYWIDAGSGAVLLSFDDLPRIMGPSWGGVEAPVGGAILKGENGSVATVNGWDENGAFYMANVAKLWTVFNAGPGVDANDYAYRLTDDWGTSDRAEVSCGRALERIQDYYTVAFGRNSYDDFGANMVASVHYGAKYNNAFWSSSTASMFIGDGDGKIFAPLGVQDVVAHEYQHAVTEYTAGLFYYGESGALNESFSDIFGVLVEFYTQPDGRKSYPLSKAGAADWFEGEDCTVKATALRDLQDPMNTETVGAGSEQPSRYRGTYWELGSRDLGGVHINSTVQSHFFYLLCEGGSGTNDGIAYTVRGIGSPVQGEVPVAAELAYETLTQYVGPYTDYAGAREAWLAAALDFDENGWTDNAILSVIQAWGAVGVGSSDLVDPASGYTGGGDVGKKPFDPTNKVFTIQNPSLNPMSWTVTTEGSSWLILDTPSVDVDAQSSAIVTLAFDQDVAATLPEGIYRDKITFVDQSGFMADITRDVLLRVGVNYVMQVVPNDWVDPLANGHTVVDVTRGKVKEVALPFGVNYYGIIYSNLYVSPYGMAGFSLAGLDQSKNQPLPSPAPVAALFPFWGQINGGQLPGTTLVGVRGSAPNREVIVTWQNAPYVSNSALRATVQASIFENDGLDYNDIVFRYKDVNESDLTLGGGLSQSVGIEDEYAGLHRAYDYNGSGLLANDQALLFTRTPFFSGEPPIGTIRAAGISGSNVTFDIRFDKTVTGLTPDALDLSHTLSAPVSVTRLMGSGMRYLAQVSPCVGLGRIEMSVPAGAVVDGEGYVNDSFGPAVFAMPFEGADTTDDFERNPVLWTSSEPAYEEWTTKAWVWGKPNYVSGPATAHSGSNCWGTILTNDYPNGMNAWVMSPSITVGAHPILDFWLWRDLNFGDYGYVEVDNGSGWQNVTPFGSFIGFSNEWLRQTIELDDAQFGSRTIRVRFRATSDYAGTRAGMYIDDVRVSSRRAPGIWVVSYTPDHSQPSNTVALSMTVYNSTTNVQAFVNAMLGSPDAGVTFTGAMPVAYGTLVPGALATNPVPALMRLGSPGNFVTSPIHVFHQTRTGAIALSQESLPFSIDGLLAYVATNRLVAMVSTGVVDWLSRPLHGNGDDQSCLYQVIDAGANGIADPPLPNGQVSGDDRLLYGSALQQPWGRFGEGGVPADFGQFLKSFDHGLVSGAMVYVRAWDGPSFDGSVVYGDSVTRPVTGAALQTNDFGSWVVGVPINPTRDSNGDTIEDGYAILHGMDPRDPIVALAPTWSFAQAPMGAGTTSLTPPPGQFKANTPSPTRLFYRGAYLYVLDSGYNRIQVWNRFTRQYIGSYGSQGTDAGQFSGPMGLAVDPRTASNRFAVADTGNFRVQVFEFDPATGTNITFLFEFGAYGSAGDQFEKPTDVALAPDGRIYVTDIRTAIVAQHLLDRSLVKVFSATGSYLSTLAGWGTGTGQVSKPWGVCVGADGSVIVADTEDSRVETWAATGAFRWTQSAGGTNGPMLRPRDVGIGVDGRVYVADTDNSRIHVYSRDGGYIVTLGTRGTGVDQDLRMPYAVAPVTDSNIVYVADTYHNRVLTLMPIFDHDGDGMDDLWEQLHGLNPNDPSDAWADYNANGIINIGEYRLQHDPGVPLLITGFSVGNQTLSWGSVNTGAIYQVEYTHQPLASNLWQAGPTVTAQVAGSMALTNGLPLTNWLEFIRIRCLTNSF